MRDGKVLAQGGCGWRDVERKLPADENTLYGIASCSKSFNSCLIAMLVLMRDEPEARNLFLIFFAQAVPAPILLGGGASAFLYSRYLKNPPAVKEAEPWKRQ